MASSKPASWLNPASRTCRGLSKWRTELCNSIRTIRLHKSLRRWRPIGAKDFEDAIHWAHQCGDDDRQALCVLALANAASGQIELARQQVAQLQQGSDGFHIQVSLKRQDAAHEAAFFNILLEEVKRTLSLE